ncbi:hypothetical protein TREES_T100009654 [Tupaia chinensis]|uniref:Uncharacterized protein n=1 Tax=Tupaia chinensis TaxID=246437 RepID=L9LC19_TUPCH|nr:hypothetical protein TREES_T100009654 [Tupaia chinensis]
MALASSDARGRALSGRPFEISKAETPVGEAGVFTLLASPPLSSQPALWGCGLVTTHLWTPASFQAVPIGSPPCARWSAHLWVCGRGQHQPFQKAAMAL